MRRTEHPTKQQPAYGWFLPVPEPVREPDPEPTPDRPPERLLLSVHEAADLLGISATLTRRLVADGALTSFKIGARRLIRRQDIEEYVSELDNKGKD